MPPAIPSSKIKPSSYLKPVPLPTEAQEGELRAKLGAAGADREVIEKFIKGTRCATELAASGHELSEAIKLLRGNRAGFAIGAAGAMLHGYSAGADGLSSESQKLLKASAGGANLLSTSINLMKLGADTAKLGAEAAKLSPARIGAIAVVTAAQKGLIAAGIITESDRAKCGVAIAKLGVDGFLGTATLGGGTPITIGITVLGLMLDLGDTFVSCRGDGPTSSSAAPRGPISSPGPTPSPGASAPSPRIQMP